MGAMLDYTLTADELAQLRAEHRRTRDQREADRIKAVVSLASGWAAEQVAAVLLIDPNTVRNSFRRYRQGGLSGLLQVQYHGSDCALDDAELAALDLHVQGHLYLTAKEVAVWVEEQFAVVYTASGMTALLHRLGFVYKKPKAVPGKADAKAQEAFLGGYAMSKFALTALTHGVRREGRDAGIRATVICPGYVATDMTANETEIPRQDMTQPGDLAELVETVLRLPNNAAVSELLVHCQYEPML
jgi:transposase